MIPEGHTIEDIKKREQIIREFTESGKKKASQTRCLTFALMRGGGLRPEV